MNHLHFTNYSTERDLRLAIVEAGRICYETGLMPADTGSISTRLGGDKLLMTPAGVCNGRLATEDLLILDLDGNVVKADARRSLKASAEVAMHLEVYRQRSDVRGVLHAHPAYATALTIADIPFPEDVLPEVLEVLGPVPTSRFPMPTASDNAFAIHDLIMGHKAVLIRQHGAVSFGIDLDDALMYMEHLEHVAKSVVLAQLLGKVNRLPEGIVADLRAKAQK
jgi:L-fuculose-phosphate aldolase